MVSPSHDFIWRGEETDYSRRICLDQLSISYIIQNFIPCQVLSQNSQVTWQGTALLPMWSCFTQVFMQFLWVNCISYLFPNTFLCRTEIIYFAFHLFFYAQYIFCLPYLYLTTIFYFFHISDLTIVS